MCIGLAWPPAATLDGSRVLETVPTTPPRPLKHNDIHDGNGKRLNTGNGRAVPSTNKA